MQAHAASHTAKERDDRTRRDRYSSEASLDIARSAGAGTSCSRSAMAAGRRSPRLYERTNPRLYAIVSAVVSRQEHAEARTARPVRAALRTRAFGRAQTIARAQRARLESAGHVLADRARARCGRRECRIGIARKARLRRALVVRGCPIESRLRKRARSPSTTPTPAALMQRLLCVHFTDGPRQALTLAFYEGLDYTEIATQLGQDARSRCVSGAHGGRTAAHRATIAANFNTFLTPGEASRPKARTRPASSAATSRSRWSPTRLSVAWVSRTTSPGTRCSSHRMRRAGSPASGSSSLAGRGRGTTAWPEGSEGRDPWPRPRADHSTHDE